jgi:DNA mismatch repair ATPase MutS
VTHYRQISQYVESNADQDSAAANIHMDFMEVGEDVHFLHKAVSYS